MRIGGFQPVTASDYPGRMAAIIFTQGCNFRCPFCHNGRLLPLEAMGRHDQLSDTEVLAFLERRRTVLGGVVLSGGEPCLQDDLPWFCQKLHQMGFAVKLDTNGSYPEVIEQLLSRKLVDFIAMDIKAPLHRLAALTGVNPNPEAILHSMTLIAASGVDHLFRTTDVAALLSPKDHLAIKNLIPDGSPHIVQPFIPENALDATLRQNREG